MEHTSSKSFLGRRIAELAQGAPHRKALTDSLGRSICYKDLASSFRFSQTQWLQQHDFGAGPVLIYLPHGCAKAVCLLHLLSAAVPALVVSTRTPPREAQNLIEHLQIQTIITTPLLMGKLVTAPSVTKNWPITISEFDLGCPLQFIQLQNTKPQKNHDHNLAWLLLTSGSSGASKAVELSWQNLQDRILGEIDLFKISPGDQILNCLSFAHDLGLNQLLTSITAGATLQILSLPLASDLYRTLANESFQGITGTPLLWNSLLSLKQVDPLNFSGYLTVSGGTLTSPQLKKMKYLFPHARMIKTYGQTETFRSLAQTDDHKMMIDSHGKGIAGVHLEVINDQLQPCAVGEIGQLIHFGQGTMSGYFNDLNLTTQKLISSHNGAGHGVLTGDYFRVLKEGEFQFMGRRDDLIKRMDHRVHLSEIRNGLCQFSWVRDAYVTSIDQRLIAWLEVVDDEPLTTDDIKRHCLGTMAAYKVPDEFYLVQDFPSTFSDKIDGRRLIESRVVSL
jgi:acyl-CoA synthetase (AMP-forming)/AMP-acid ligase II